MIPYRTLSIVAVAVACLVAGCGEKKDAPSSPAVSVTVVELFQDYQKSLIAADQKYMGKYIEVRHVNGSIHKDDAGYYASLCESCRFVKPTGSGLRTTDVKSATRRAYESSINTKYRPGVVLRIAPSATKGFENLSRTSDVTIRGRCTGAKSDPETDPDFFVLIEDVILVN